MGQNNTAPTTFDDFPDRTNAPTLVLQITSEQYIGASIVARALSVAVAPDTFFSREMVRDTIMQFRDGICTLNKLQHLNIVVQDLHVEKMYEKMSHVKIAAQCLVKQLGNQQLIVVPNQFNMELFAILFGSIYRPDRDFDYTAIVHMPKYNVSFGMKQDAEMIWNMEQTTSFEFGVDFLVDFYATVNSMVDNSIVQVIQCPEETIKYKLLRSNDRKELELENCYLLVNGVEFHKVFTQACYLRGISSNGIDIHISMHYLSVHYSGTVPYSTFIQCLGPANVSFLSDFATTNILDAHRAEHILGIGGSLVGNTVPTSTVQVRGIAKSTTQQLQFKGKQVNFPFDVTVCSQPGNTDHTYYITVESNYVWYCLGSLYIGSEPASWTKPLQKTLDLFRIQRISGTLPTDLVITHALMTEHFEWILLATSKKKSTKWY